MTLRRVGIGLVLWLGVAALPGAQENAQVFRSGTNLVNLTVAVTDRGGRPVRGLRKQDFTVLDEDAPQELAFFASGTDVPISVGLLVDTSGSMVDKLEDVEDALRHFVDALRSDDEVFLMEFADRADMVAGFGDRNLVQRAIPRLEARGGTALYDGVIDALRALQGARHPKRVLLLISDGNDTTSIATSGNAAKAVIQSEAAMYALGIGHGRRGSFGHLAFELGDGVDMGTLRRMTDQTGGRSYSIEDAHRGGEDLIDRAVAEIGAELREQYSLGYYPPPADGKPRFRRIQVKVADRAVRVRTRTGYWTGTPQQP